MTDPVAVPKVLLIGHAARREFRALCNWLQRHTQVVLRTESIPQALSGTDQVAAADFTVVLQSYSDQFDDRSVNALIGQTLFRRLFCCYSVACESDGRNRNVWPDAVRVPVRLANSVLMAELQRWQAGEDASPPTLARDEVFARRAQSLELGRNTMQPAKDRLPDAAKSPILVVSPDRVLRQAIAAVLREQQTNAFTCPLLNETRTNTTDDFDHSRPMHLVLHDLDPWSPLVEQSIQLTRQRHPAAVLWGLATMPDAGLTIEVEDLQLPVIVPKLDLQHGLCWHLRGLLDGRIPQPS